MMLQALVMKYYSGQELQAQLGFGERFWRERAQAGDFTLREGETVICEPVEIAGELRYPAAGVNAWLARRVYRYDPGIKARNQAELRRKLEGRK